MDAPTVTTRTSGDATVISVARPGNGTYELSVLPVFTDHEPRARDLDLAAWLEFSNPRTIRKLIARHELAGNITPTRFCPTVGQNPKGGRPREEFWLSAEDAAFIATQSETPKAVHVTKAIIAVFLAAQRGMLTAPAAPTAVPPPAPAPTTFPPLTPEESSSIATELLSAAAVVKAELADLLERARRDGSIRRVTLERALAPHALHRRCSVDDLVDKIVAAWLLTAEPRVLPPTKTR